MTEIINFDYPLNRFYLKPRIAGVANPALTVWEVWQYGWRARGDEQPDWMIGCYFTKELAMKAIEEREAREKGLYGVWRFFVD